MARSASEIELGNLRKADEIYAQVAALSRRLFPQDTIRDMESFVREAELLLRGVNSADVVLGIFDHNTYNPVLEVGDRDFWGPLPEVSQVDKMRLLLSLLDADYAAFPTDSSKWFLRVMSSLTFEERHHIGMFHCGIAYTRTDGRPIRCFRKAFRFTTATTGNSRSRSTTCRTCIICSSWAFATTESASATVQTGAWCSPCTLASWQRMRATATCLSAREKEILAHISTGLETKEIADRRDISVNTVGNDRSNMVQHLGARDSTALVQIAKMAGLI